MARYFMEVFYKGTHYAGFQVQKNANSIQAEIEKALKVYLRTEVELTGSSRTDTGVHALQNYFHFDFESEQKYDLDKTAYRLNAILPDDIVIKKIKEVDAKAHCRFDAKFRTYEYTIYYSKDPFLADRCYFYPYKLDMALLNEAATILKTYRNFEAFSKRNTQVKSFECELYTSEWLTRDNTIIYRVSGNRFLRGMVKGLVGTMLKVGKGKTTIPEFIKIIESKDSALVDFSVDAHGLTLVAVQY
ncbi:MAG: tRNA pseudouridine(38-40) synthase TruA [Ferruginibacter sp.]